MADLHAESLSQDPRIAQAKSLLLQAVAEHAAKLTAPKPADPHRKSSYEQMLKQFASMRGGELFYPYLGSGLGRGALVELLDGSVKYDFITGIGVHALGHNHPDLISACVDAAVEDTVMQGNLQQNASALAISKLLLDAVHRNDCGLKHCFLSSSGAMANENAIKLAFHQRHPASRLLAFDRCFMGRTLVLSQITDKPAFRQGLPKTVDVDYVPFYDPTQPAPSTQRTVNAIKAHLHRYPEQHAAMCLELVQGEGGYYPGSREFFIAVINVLREHQVAVYIDEVQTFGRSTQLFAFQHFGLDRLVDIVTIGKLSQVCATLFTAPFIPKPGLISQTFTASSSALRAGRVVIEHLINGGYFGPEGKIAKLHEYFANKLTEISNRHPTLCTRPFGFGTMIAFTPLGGDADKVKQFCKALFDAGVIAFSAGGTPARARFLVPVGVVTTHDIDAVCEIVEQTLVKLAGKSET